MVPLQLRRRAGRALAVIDPETMLEIAKRPVGLPMVAQRRAARRERRPQHLADRARQAGEAGGRLSRGRDETARGGERRDARPMQRLADIDIAEPRDQPLIEKQRLHRRLPPPKGLREKRRVERLLQRFDAEPLEELVAVELARGDEQHEAETARVVIGDAGAVLHVEDDMIMRGALVARMVEKPRQRPVHPKGAAHAQMHDERLPGLEVRQQILRAPTQAEHAAARQSGGEIWREGKAQIGPPLLDPQDARAGKRREQPPPNGFDLG